MVSDGHWLEVVGMSCGCRVWPIPTAVMFAPGRCGLCGKNPTSVVGAPYDVWVPDHKTGGEQ